MPTEVPFLGDYFVTYRRGAGPLPPWFNQGGLYVPIFTGPPYTPPPEEPLAEVVVEANRPPPPPPAEEPLAEVVVEANRLNRDSSQGFVARTRRKKERQSILNLLSLYAQYKTWLDSYIPKPKEPLRRRPPPRRSPKPAPARRPRPPKRQPTITPGKKPWWWPKYPSNPAQAAVLVTANIFGAIDAGIKQTVATAGRRPPPQPPVPWAIAPPSSPPARQPAPAADPLPFLGTYTVTAPRPLAPPRLFPFAPPVAFPLPMPYAPPLPFAPPAPYAPPLPYSPPVPAPRPVPRPGLAFPFSPGRPGTPSYGSPGLATGLQPFPVPKEELDKDKCKDKKDKKKKKKKSRQVCYRGTYKEFSFGLSKSRKEEIPCELTAPRKGRKLPKPADILPFPKRF